MKRPHLPCIRSAFVALALFTQSAFAASISLSFAVSGLTLTDCSGALQPTCSTSSPSGFTEKFSFDLASLSSSTILTGPPIYQSTATYAFPSSSTGNPYSAALQAFVVLPLTSNTAYSQLDSFFDADASFGVSSAFLFTDQVVDVTNAGAGLRTQQEFKLSYNLNALFASLGLYSDLTTSSSFDFFNRYVGSLTGAFDEFGTASIFDGTTGLFNAYRSLEYIGSATLVGVALVPEPATPLLIVGAVAAMMAARRRRMAAVVR